MFFYQFLFYRNNHDPQRGFPDMEAVDHNLLRVSELSLETSGFHEAIVETTFTEQQLSSREVEDQTFVTFNRTVQPLWLALKSVLEECFNEWSADTQTSQAIPIAITCKHYRRYVQEVERLVLVSLANPLELKAVARVLQLGFNARGTLDFCLKLLLSGQSSSIPKIDWALGGISQWEDVPIYTFEERLGMDFVKNRMFYSTEKNNRKGITTKQIANIFRTKDYVIEAIESRALQQIRSRFQGSNALNEFALNFLALD